MSILRWGHTVTPDRQPAPRPTHHVRESISSALSHIPHSLPEPHVRYPPLHPSYLESSRMSREMKHL